MSKMQSLPSRIRRVVLGAGVLALLAAGAIILGLRRENGIPASMDEISPRGVAGKRKWSAEVVPYPGFPLEKVDRECSHQEIALRHKRLVLRELPAYVTELRGVGAKKETGGTSAAWFFVVPRQHLPEFEKYLLELGIPNEALREEKRISFPPPYDDEHHDPPSAVPATRLLFGTSLKANGEGEILGMDFGKSSETMTYYPLNPNLEWVTPRITVGWKSGNVQFLEMPDNPDWE